MKKLVAMLAWCFVVAALSACRDASADRSDVVTLGSVFATEGGAVDVGFLHKSPALVRADAVYTGNQHEMDRAMTQIVVAWGVYRELGRDFVEHGLHDKMLEFEDDGERYRAILAHPANLHLDRLRAQQPVQLVVQRIGSAIGRPVVLVYFAGTPQEVAEALASGSLQSQLGKPLHRVTSEYDKGWLRFELAGRQYTASMNPLMPSRLDTYPDQGRMALHLALGDIQNVNAKLSLGGLRGAGDYDEYVEFDASVRAGGASVRLTPENLHHCKLLLAELGAQQARGSLRCTRGPAIGASAPAAFDFELSR